MATMTGSNGDDSLTGTVGNDTINSGNGDDSVDGGSGNDSLNGGAGSDTLDGGSGSDQLNGGSGSDTLIYNVSENLATGTKDVYTGGSGVDTLELQLTSAQWLESSIQTQIAAYLAHLSAVTNARTGEVSNGSASDFVFSFGSSTLTVQMTEVLRILVDGIEQNPANEAVTALSEVKTTTEDGPGCRSMSCRTIWFPTWSRPWRSPRLRLTERRPLFSRPWTVHRRGISSTSPTWLISSTWPRARARPTPSRTR